MTKTKDQLASEARQAIYEYLASYGQDDSTETSARIEELTDENMRAVETASYAIEGGK